MLTSLSHPYPPRFYLIGGLFSQTRKRSSLYLESSGTVLVVVDYLPFKIFRTGSMITANKIQVRKAKRKINAPEVYIQSHRIR
jgi:hypothetical protein